MIARITCLSRSQSPMTQMLGVIGNEAVVNVEPVRTPLGNRLIPFLSGNAIRHRMIREPAATYLIDRWELAGTLTRDELNLLYHGGLRREKGKRQSTSMIAEMQRLFPMLSLLGCCLPDGIVAGNLRADRAMLVCRENLPRIKSCVPSGWDVPDDLAPATSFTARWQYVRGVVPQTVAVVGTDEDIDDNTMMPFSGTCVIAGAEWLHGFTIEFSDLLQIGCLMHSLQLWSESGGTIGGQSSRGHGQLTLSCHVQDVTIDVQYAIDAYKTHVETVCDEGVAFLRSVYNKPETDEKPAKKTRKAKS